MAMSLFQLFSHSVEDFLSGQDTGVSVLSVLRGRTVLQKLCRVHPALGPLYGLLLMGGSVWLLARLCGTVLIRTYRYTTLPFKGVTGKEPSLEVVAIAEQCYFCL